MFLLRRPSPEVIRRFLESQERAPFPYEEVGTSRRGAPPGFPVVDHNRVLLNTGEEAFRLGVAALRQWKMFDLGWVELCWREAPVEVGTTVGILARHFGFWSLHASRVVYLLDEEEGDVRRQGFAYGTLSAHGESGEERFSIEWRRTDGTVWYDLFAFSRPGHWPTAIGYPVGRLLQKRFARDSKRAMVRAVAEGQATATECSSA